MAEGFARALHPDLLKVASAGIEQHGMNPRTLRVMLEAGIDISDQYSKTVDELDSQDFDFLITVCDHAQEVCPVLPSKSRVLHHSFTDPAMSSHLPTEEMILTQYRQVRDEIEQWVSELPGELISQ